MGALLAPALPAITASFPALWPILAVVLLAFAITYLVRDPLTTILTRIPLIGGAVAGAVAGGINWIIALVNGWIDDLAWPAIQLIMAPVSAAVAFASATVGAIEYGIGQVAIITGSLGSTVSYLVRKAAELTTQLAKALTVAAGAALTATKAWDLGKLLRDVLLPAAAAAALAASQVFTRSKVDAEAKRRAQAIGATRTDLRGRISDEAARRQAADASAAAATVAGLAALSVAVKTAQARARTYSDEQRRALELELEQLRTRDIPRAEARATARADAVAAELAAVRLSCITPICNLFGPGTSMAQTLIAEAEWLILLGIVGNAVRDPEGTAQVVAGVGAGLHSVASVILQPFVRQAA